MNTKKHFSKNFLTAIVASIAFSCGGETESISTEDITTEEITAEKPAPWFLYTDSTALYSIKFPEEPVSRIDTTEQFFVHIAAYETETSFYKVTAFVQKIKKSTGKPMDYVYGMRTSLNDKYLVTLEEEKIVNDRTGLHIEALRDDWAFARFFVAENDILYIIDMASYGSDVPSSISVDDFRSWFEILTVE